MEIETKSKQNLNIDNANDVLAEEPENQEDEILTDGEILQEDETENKPSEIDKLKEELSKQKDLFLRTAAEYENFRKRTEREKSAIYSDAISVAVLSILPIADSLERAINTSEGSDEEYKKGLKMIKDQFDESLKGLSVEEFGKQGELFNPELHNAVSHIDDKSLDENVISQVFQKGYKMNDKIIRHAMVQVAN